MVLVIAAVLLAVILLVALLAVRRGTAASTPGTARLPRDQRLPAGADAALWSIVEATPDPRNHLALTRDLTGEVRVAGTVLDPEFRASTIAPPPRPAPAGGSSVRIIETRSGPAVPRTRPVAPSVEDAPADDRRQDVA